MTINYQFLANILGFVTKKCDFSILRYKNFKKNIENNIEVKCDFVTSPLYNKRGGPCMDFLEVVEKKAVNTSKGRSSGAIDIYPDFKVCKSKDLMVRGRSFYAIWDAEQESWLTDEMEVVRLVDKELFEYRDKILGDEDHVNIKTLASYSTGVWNQWIKFIKSMPDNYHTIDNKILFANDKITKTSYSTHHLPYELKKGSTKAYDRLMSVLYDDEERQKLEWTIGAILTGDSKRIQKFCVLYGDAGSGKSTFLNILQRLVEGYYIAFNAKALVGNNNIFGTEVFKNNPLVAIQHDGDLSKIEDNSTLNSIISHEQVIINEKHKSQYSMPINCFLLMGTNKPVKITDSKSGIIRRLIDVRPSGRHLSPKEYDKVVGEIEFELGAIAYKCIDIYNNFGIKFYNSYRPKEMMFETNVMFNFVEEHYFYFLNEVGYIQLKDAYSLYKEFCQNNSSGYIMPRHSFREELKAYFNNYAEQRRIDGKAYRSVYWDFKKSSIDNNQEILTVEEEHSISELVLDQKESIFDTLYATNKAQYATENGTPHIKWDKCVTKLSDLDTKKLHYVRLEPNHIVIDFDLKNNEGDKDRDLNLKEAAKWPITYAEFSKSGAGIHLHYIYDGDPSELSRIYSDGIEIKIFAGKSSLRRQLSLCNNASIEHISSGLPLKEKGSSYQMMDNKAVKTEKALRDLIVRNLNKEILPGTKPSIDFIKKILDDAYNSGLVYDVNDMRSRILIFAMNSSNHADYCVSLVPEMKFASEKASEPLQDYKIEDYVFFDVEVFPNLFIIIYKLAGDKHKPVTLINPTSEQVGELFHFKLIGFNNRRYDNHILYARYIGYTNEQLFKLSTKIVDSGGSNDALFREAYNISYSDVYCFSNKKQSLKKFGIELGLHHHEFAFPWDKPVSEDKWDLAAKYCANDVILTEATFNDRKADWAARLILAELTGGTPNNSTNQLVTKLIFGDDSNPELVYTDLSETFPGYKWEKSDDGHFHNMYMGTDVGLGGYVYAEPGIHHNVTLLDIASMHPTSLINMNYFGKYTKNYASIRDARILIKHGDKEGISKLFNGMLVKYLEDETIMDDLAYALKIALNSTYGLTSARFPNVMKHPKNVNNIVALRGALFMRTLQDEIKKRGYTVAHIKTDSVKIVDAKKDIIDFCYSFAKQYGYEFEHEATYEKMCLVNDAVYIAKYSWSSKEMSPNKWTATGAQFQHPYVFKKLFTKEPIIFKDLCEVKSVTGSSALYLDMNEKLDPDEHDYRFIGRVGEFCPIQEGHGGGILYRNKDGKYYAAAGTKGYRWLESEVVSVLDRDSIIDLTYFKKLVDDAIDTINKFGDFEQFSI